MSTSAARQYVAESMETIPGWFSPPDAYIFCLIAEAQQQASLAGDILEIGAYQGKSAILLGHLLGADDRLVVCDLFGAPARSQDNQRESTEWYDGLTLSTFLANYRRFHEQPPIIYRCPSSDIPLEERKPKFRIVHIDGSHQFADVSADIALARSATVPGGVVILDDYRSAHCPGVAAAVWKAVHNDGLIPICVTMDKMYTAWPTSSTNIATGVQQLLGNVPSVRILEEQVLNRSLPIVLPADYGGTRTRRKRVDALGARITATAKAWKRR